MSKSMTDGSFFGTVLKNLRNRDSSGLAVVGAGSYQSVSSKYLSKTLLSSA